MQPFNLFIDIIISSIFSGTVCWFIGAHKQIGPFVGAIIGFTFGILAFSFIFFLPRKRHVNVAVRLKRYQTMRDEGLISRVEYSNLKERLFEEQF